MQFIYLKIGIDDRDCMPITPVDQKKRSTIIERKLDKGHEGIDRSPAVYLIPTRRNRENSEGAISLLDEIKRQRRLVVGTSIPESRFSNVLRGLEHLTEDEVLNAAERINGNREPVTGYLKSMLLGFKRLVDTGARVYFIDNFEPRAEEVERLERKAREMNNIVSSSGVIKYFGSEFGSVVFECIRNAEYQIVRYSSMARSAIRMIGSELEGGIEKFAVAIVVSPEAVPILTEKLRNLHPEVLKNPNEGYYERGNTKLRLELMEKLEKNLYSAPLAAAKILAYELFNYSDICVRSGMEKSRKDISNRIANVGSFKDLLGAFSAIVEVLGKESGNASMPIIEMGDIVVSPSMN